MDIDANAVIEELAQLVAQQAKQLAIQRVQLVSMRAALDAATTGTASSEG